MTNLSAAQLVSARAAWKDAGEKLAAIERTRAAGNMPADPAIAKLRGEWIRQGAALEAASKVSRAMNDGNAGLGFLWLIPVAGAIATAIGGIFVTKKAIDVKKAEADRQAHILEMVDSGEITPAQADTLQHQAAGAAGGKSTLESLFGIAPATIIGILALYVFRHDIARMLKGGRGARA